MCPLGLESLAGGGTFGAQVWSWRWQEEQEGIPTSQHWEHPADQEVLRRLAKQTWCPGEPKSTQAGEKRRIWVSASS